jgi:primosomal protein N' (replication factor Y)
MPEPSIILRIAIPRPLYSLFDYLHNHKQTPQVGCRVHVPFGYTQVTGIIVAIDSHSEHASLLPIHTLLDTTPLFDQTTIDLLSWASQYYHHPIGEVFQNAIPIALRGTRKTPTNYRWLATATQTKEEIKTLLSRSKKQQNIYQAITTANRGLSENTLKSHFGNSWRSGTKQLEKKQLISQQEESISFPSSKNAIQRDKTLTLT